MFIRSAAALSYKDEFLKQCPSISPPLEGELRLTARIFYSSRRPDLDESLIMDLCQGRIFLNDRQIREKHIYGSVDKTNPRAEIEIETI